MSQNDIYKKISGLIKTHKKDNWPLVVGINEVDGSGKTQFTKALLPYLEKSIAIHIDDFHNPKEYRYRKGEQSPEGYYNDSINYEKFIKEALQPIKNDNSYPLTIKSKLFDLDNNCDDFQFLTINKDTIILVEGVFLFRTEIAPLIDLKIFIECSLNNTIKRMKYRDVENQNNPQHLDEYEHRILKKYVPGQQLYFNEVSPKSISDIVINNSNFEEPKIIKMPEYGARD